MFRAPSRRWTPADETRPCLVVIDAVRRDVRLSRRPYDRRLEKWSLLSRPRRLDLRGTDLDPLSAQLTMAETTARLKRGLKRLKQLGHDLEHPRTAAHAGPDAQPPARKSVEAGRGGSERCEMGRRRRH